MQGTANGRAAMIRRSGGCARPDLVKAPPTPSHLRRNAQREPRPSPPTAAEASGLAIAASTALVVNMRSGAGGQEISRSWTSADPVEPRWIEIHRSAL